VTTRPNAFLAIALLCGGLLVGSPAPAVARDRVPAAMRWCLTDQWGAARPIPHLTRQKRVARHALRTTDPDYDVKRAQPTQLGVIVLVDGNVAKATRELRGADHVVSWTKHFLSDFPPGFRVDVVLTDMLHPLLKQVVRSTSGIPGIVEPAYWQDGGAVVLTWKAPVPPEVQALAGVRPDGSEVRVIPRPYSMAELLAGQDRLIDFLDARGIRWSSVSHCDSDAGLELDVPGNPDSFPLSQAELDQAAGMRVLLLGGTVATPA
jgi:hypothetical protein